MPIYRSGFDTLQMRSLLDDPAYRKKRQTEGGYMGGPTAGRFGMMSAAPVSADEMNALTTRNIGRAQYGRYGRGGLERERLAAETGIKREGLRSAEKITGIKEKGAMGRNIYSEDAATGRTRIGEDRQRQQDIMRFHPGDAFTPKGLEGRQLDILEREQKLKEENARNAPKMPKVFQEQSQGTLGGEATYRMPSYNPETGQYSMQTLPFRGGLTGPQQLPYNEEAERGNRTQLLREQGLTGQQPKGIDPVKWFNSLPPEEQEYWRQTWQQRNNR